MDDEECACVCVSPRVCVGGASGSGVKVIGDTAACKAGVLVQNA